MAFTRCEPEKMKDLYSKATLQFIKPCLAVILISAKKIKVSLGIFLHEESFAFVSDLGLQTAGHKHRTGQNPPEMGENSLPASDRHINLLEVIKLPWSMWINMEISKHIHHFLRTKYGNTRYFHDSLPYGTGPGTDTDLASVMNGEGNRRFDEVFSIGSSWKLEISQNCLFQYISFVTIGKDPKDPSLVRKRHLTLLESISKTLGDVSNCSKQTVTVLYLNFQKLTVTNQTRTLPTNASCGSLKVLPEVQRVEA